MCLLVHQPKSVSFDNAFLADVYKNNSDGLGIMFAKRGKLYVHKALPHNAEAFIDFYRAHADGRECIWHARMKTHGKIDFDNCHPYEVTPTIYMAHNGVLSTGNDADDSRSDTWHFINYVLGPTLTADGELLLDNGWQQFVGAMIGASNKFGFMTANGDAVIINRKSGVEFQGAWLSNTYAWNSEKYGFGRAAYATSSYSSPYRYVDRWEGYDWELGWEDKSSKKKASRDAASPAARENAPYQPKGIGAIIKAARNSYLRNTLEQWVIDAPQKAAALINAIEDDCTEESGEIAYDDVQTTAAWIADWFDRDGYDPMSDTPDDSDDHVLDAPDNRIGSAQ